MVNPVEYADTGQAMSLLEAHLGVTVKRPTLGSWINAGYLPGVKTNSGRTLFVPRAAIPLFRMPKSGRYARRENLARGVGIALKTLGVAEVSAQDATADMVCPRCDMPWVIRGDMPTVMGHEHDRCCCNLDCLYIGSDFLRGGDERAWLHNGKVRFTV